MVGAHPDDEDTNLITWLARGHQVETAYLSLTRGDGGQNLIGNELGEGLGAIRTEELLAARRIDGGRQYFTRAYDFGFSKDSAETFTHWPREALLGDVVRVIRAFRPHVVVAVWTGTPADGHGHHQVAGILAREAYEAAADTVRFPELAFGAAWAPGKFYRSRRAAGLGQLTINVGAFDPVLGRSYAAVATESRAAHRSQGQGRLAPRGVQWDYLAREATRVNAEVEPARETSIFDGIDTTWARFASLARTPATRALIDSLPALARAARTQLDLRSPGTVAPLLVRAAALLERARDGRACRFGAVARGCSPLENDFGAAIEQAHRRAGVAALAAAGVEVTPVSDREFLAYGDTASISVEVTNRGGAPVTLTRVSGSGVGRVRDTTGVVVMPDSVVTVARRMWNLRAGTASWWVGERQGNDLFPEVRWPADGVRDAPWLGGDVPSVSGVAIAEDDRMASWIDITFRAADGSFTHRFGPVVSRRIDPVYGELRRPLVPVSPVSLLFDRTLELARANEVVDRMIRLRVRSYSTQPRHVKYQFRIPDGFRTDPLPDTATLAPLETREIAVHVRGKLPVGKYALTAGATDGGANFYGTGVFTIEYEHITPIVMSRSTGLWMKSVDVAIPAGVHVAYVPGVSDDVAPVLRQLDVALTTVEPDRIPSTDLSAFQVVVLGPRVYQRAPLLAAFNARLEEFAKNGGTVVVQYGQQEMTRPGMLPFPVSLAQQPQRVTIENAPVQVTDPKAHVLLTPNRVTQSDFDGWVQERSLYMPSRADSAWRTVVEMHDPGEPPNPNGILVGRLGKGTYVYTTLSLFRQLPAGNDGAIRLFMNLLAAGLPSPSQ
ncbi:MAG TPA: PIG-L family deacetylase [Gemmatimonadaceae bacterium]|nr:PIG-L family deacetylase [Gemmatimonadaceae bacterium]